MDHPEPINVKPGVNIPQSRKDLTLEEARQFADEVMLAFRSLENLSDLRSMYETGKQLSRVFFDCHQHRAEIAQHLTTLDYPAFASKMMKKLNNMGVFKNDDIWFSSFYFYNTTWNFSEIWPDFASALGQAGLPNLLNLNIGHQPYLENLASKNVYYLIKASLSIIHNIARVPNNVHHFSSEAVRQALLHLSTRDEEFLRCVSDLCLAYVLNDNETDCLINNEHGRMNNLQALFSYITTARNSEKHRCHGLQLADLLSAVSALSINDSIKSSLLADQSFVPMLRDLIDASLVPEPSLPVVRDAEESMKILLSLAVGPQTTTNQLIGQLGSWHTDLLNNPGQFSQLSKGVSRLLEMLVWRLASDGAPRNNPMKDKLPHLPGQVLLSYASASRQNVKSIADRLKISVLVGGEADEGARLSGLQAMTSSQLNWLDQMDTADVIVVCFNELYRQSPACRLEAEYLHEYAQLNKKHMVFVNLQAKYKPSGWLLNMTPVQKVFDVSGKKDQEQIMTALMQEIRDLQELFRLRAQKIVAPVEVVADAAGGVVVNSPPPPPPPAQVNTMTPTVNHHGDHTGLPTVDRNTGPTNSLFAYPLPTSTSSQQNICVRGWKQAVRSEIRNWNSAKVAQWFKFRGLQAVTTNLAGGLDGVMLSQLAAMRCSAPEAFHRRLQEDLGLNLVDCLKLLEALDDLAPEDPDEEQRPHNGADSSKADDPDEAYEKFSTVSAPSNGQQQRAQENFFH